MFGWCLAAFGIGQLLFWAIREIYAKCRENGGKLSTREAFHLCLQPSPEWGPLDGKLLNAYKYYTDDLKVDDMFRRSGVLHRIYDNICG